MRLCASVVLVRSGFWLALGLTVCLVPATAGQPLDAVYRIEPPSAAYVLDPGGGALQLTVQLATSCATEPANLLVRYHVHSAPGVLDVAFEPATAFVMAEDAPACEDKQESRLVHEAVIVASARPTAPAFEPLEVRFGAEVWRHGAPYHANATAEFQAGYLAGLEVEMAQNGLSVPLGESFNLVLHVRNVGNGPALVTATAVALPGAPVVSIGDPEPVQLDSPLRSIGRSNETELSFEILVADAPPGQRGDIRFDVSVRHPDPGVEGEATESVHASLTTMPPPPAFGLFGENPYRATIGVWAILSPLAAALGVLYVRRR